MLQLRQRRTFRQGFSIVEKTILETNTLEKCQRYRYRI